MSEALSQDFNVQPIEATVNEDDTSTDDGVHVDINRGSTLVSDPEKARIMASAADELMTLAANLEQTGDSQSSDFARTLRERGDELAENAKADYEKESANYKAARDFIIGRIVATAKGDIEGQVPLMTNRNNRVESVQAGNGWITNAQAEELRDLAYQVLGAGKPPESASFAKRQSTSWWTSEATAKTGIEISETRLRREGEEESLGILSELSISKTKESG